MNSKNRYIFKATVLRVIDGDTFDMQIDLGFRITTYQRLRLYGIDTPEVRGKEKEEGLKVKEYVKNLIEGKEVIVETYKIGKYGRYIVSVYIDGIDLTEHLLSKSMGKEYMINIFERDNKKK